MHFIVLRKIFLCTGISLTFFMNFFLVKMDNYFYKFVLNHINKYFVNFGHYFRTLFFLFLQFCYSVTIETHSSPCVYISIRCLKKDVILKVVFSCCSDLPHTTTHNPFSTFIFELRLHSFLLISTQCVDSKNYT